MRVKYWPISKFADWMKCTFILPFNNTEQPWITWKKESKAKKSGYWLVEGLYYLQKFVG